MLKQLRVGAVTFVGYNILFGLVIPGIDMAAHVGGLATGLFCGLVLTLVSARDAPQAHRLTPVLVRC